MAGYSLDTIAKMIGGTFLNERVPIIIDHLLTDSRKLVFPETSVFFALHGPRRDGHLYIGDLYQKGVRAFVISDQVNLSAFPGATFIVVDDTLEALQLLVAAHRDQFSLPVIGITGSNGKTIVKEWLHQLLERDVRIVRSPKSYNSQIGVPLSVWQLNGEHELALFEAGISEPGEMERLERIIRPTIGVFTHIGEAHAEGFSDLRQKIKEKLKLFLHAGSLIYCSDHPELHEEVLELQKRSGIIQLFDWGYHPGAKLQILSVEMKGKNTVISTRFGETQFNFSIPFTDAASIENAITCCAVLLHLGKDTGSIIFRMAKLNAVAMRLEMRQAINHCTLINDSYSADLDSLLIALDFLQQQQQHPGKTVILSDLPGPAGNAKEVYLQILRALVQRKVKRLIAVGPKIFESRKIFDASGMELQFYPSTQAFLDQFHPGTFRDECILLKGARVFQFERIAQQLEFKIHQTRLEINLTAISHNLKQFQQLLAPSTRIMAMVKAFSYGSGSYEIANLLQFHQVEYLTVAYADEGVELRKAGIRLPIMVMNSEIAGFPAITEYDLQPELYSFDITRAFEEFLKQEGIQDYPVHLKLDTGMHRLGFEASEISALGNFIRQSASFRVKSVFSHLTSSEDPSSDAFTLEQARLFLDCCTELEAIIGYGFLKHLANTAAISRHPSLHLDMVRLGIGLYGIDSAGSNRLILREASTLKTNVAQIKKVKTGETVGYNRMGKLTRDSLIATIRIGYADGYPRSLGNGRGWVIIRGKKAPVIGNVCMDMTMVDITEIPETTAGDEVILFGKEISIRNLAEGAGTIPYELMTGISQRVKRIYYEE